MSEPRKKKKKREPNPKLLFCEILLLVIALHLILVFSFKPVRTTARGEGRKSRYTIVYSENNPKHRENIDALKYWLEYSDPSIFLAPSSDENGFASFRIAMKMHAKEPVAFHAMKELIPVRGYLERTRPKDAFIRRMNPGDFSYPLHVPMKETVSGGNSIGVIHENNKYPLCQDIYGNFIPIMTEDQHVANIMRKNPSGVTVLRLEQAIFPDIPREVRLERSCGNSEFDTFALRQYANYIIRKKDVPELIYIFWNNDLPAIGHGEDKS